MILKLIEAYPQFEPLYREVYEMCLNLERMMDMFSKELAELDKNTVQYMIDEMQDTIDAQNNTIDEQNHTIDEQNHTIDELTSIIETQKAQLDTLLKEIKLLK